MSTLAEVTKKLDDINHNVETFKDVIAHTKEYMESGLTYEEFVQKRTAESPIDKENRIETAKLEKTRFDEQQDVFRSIIDHLQKIGEYLKTIALGTNRNNLVGAMGLAGLGGAGLGGIGRTLGAGAASIGFTAKILSGFKKLIPSKFLLSLQKLVVGSKFESVLRTIKKFFGSKIFALPAELIKKTYGLVRKLLEIVIKPIEFVVSKIGKFIAFVWNSRLARFLKVLFTPILIVLGIIETVRGIIKGYNKDGIVGGIIGGISGLLDFITFGLIPFDEIYKTLKGLVDGAVKTWNLFAEGKVAEGFKSMTETLVDFFQGLINTVVKGFTKLGAEVLDLLGFDSAADQMRKFADAFDISKAIDDLLAKFGLGKQKTFSAENVVIPSGDPYLKTSGAPVVRRYNKGEPVGSIVADEKQKYEEAKVAFETAPIHQKAMRQNMLEVAKQRYDVALALQTYDSNKVQNVDRLRNETIQQRSAIPASTITPTDRIISPGNTRSAPNVNVINAPVNNNTAAPSDSGKSPIISAFPVRNMESTFSRLSTLNAMTAFA